MELVPPLYPHRLRGNDARVAHPSPTGENDGEGCGKCQDRGYYGRTGIFELLVMKPKIQELTLKCADSNAIKREACRKGMRSLREDGMTRVLRGISTIEEVLRVTRDDFLEEIPD